MSEIEGEGRPRYTRGVIAKYSALLMTIRCSGSDNDMVS